MLKVPIPELVQLISFKDRRGAEALYDQYANVLLLAIFRIVKKKEMAEAVLEKTIVHVWLNIDQYSEHEKPFLAWMMAIARGFAYKFQEPGVVDFSASIIPMSPPTLINGTALANNYL